MAQFIWFPATEVETLIDGFDCSLLRERSKAPTSSNRQTMTELMSGFFEYFATFDFGNKVRVHVLHGVVVSRFVERCFNHQCRHHLVVNSSIHVGVYVYVNLLPGD